MASTPKKPGKDPQQEAEAWRKQVREKDIPAAKARGMDLSPEAVRAGLLQMIIQHRARSGTVLGRQASRKEDNSKAPKVETATTSGLEAFKKILNKNIPLKNEFFTLGLITRLLMDLYQNENPKRAIATAIGINQENLEQLMQAIVSQVNGRVIEWEAVKNDLLHSENSTNFFFNHLLNLNEGSTEEEIEARCRAFSGTIKRFPELMGYAHKDALSKALSANRQNKNPLVEAEDIAQEHGLPINPPHPVLLDADTSKRTLEKGGGKRADRSSPPPEDRSKTPSPEPTPRRKSLQERTAEFYRENINTPSIRFLNDLRGALTDEDTFNRNHRVQHFNGDELGVVIETIDNLFPEVTAGVGTMIYTADDMETVLLNIAQSIPGLNTNKLRTRLVEIQQQINDAYPDFKPASPPAPGRPTGSGAASPSVTRVIDPDVTRVDATRFASETIDYDDFCQKLEAKDKKLYDVLQILSHVLNETDDVYEIDSKYQLFHGESRDEVLAYINKKMEEPGLGSKLMEAVSHEDNVKNLTQGLAAFYGPQPDTIFLEATLRQLYKVLISKYPDVEPYRDTSQPDLMAGVHNELYQDLEAAEPEVVQVFNNLYHGLRDQKTRDRHFGGMSEDALVTHLNNRWFAGIGDRFRRAATKDDPKALIVSRADQLRLVDENERDDLKKQLREDVEELKKLYPKIAEETVRDAEESTPPPEPEKQDLLDKLKEAAQKARAAIADLLSSRKINFKKFYDTLGDAAWPVHRICRVTDGRNLTDEQYAAEFQHQYFKGHSRHEVADHIHRVLGDKLMKVWEEKYSDMNNDPELSFLAALAKHNNCENDPKKLKDVLRSTMGQLKNKYPKIDPYNLYKL